MNIDIIGTLYNIDTSDEENPISMALEGWHVNTTEPIIGADEFIVEPSVPRVIFSGLPTYCYKFDSEEQFREFIPLAQDDE